MAVQYLGFNDERSTINGNTIGERTVYYTPPENSKPKKQRSSLSKTLLLIPFADSFASACNGPKNISSVAGRFGSRLASWGGAYAAYGVTRGISNLICEKSASAQDLRDNHPMVSLIGEFGLFLGVYRAGQRLAESVAQKIPQSVVNYAKQGSEMIKTALEKSKFNEKVFKPAVSKISDSLNANPEVKNVVKKGLKYLAPALILAAMFDSCFFEPQRRLKQAKKEEQQAIEQMFNSFGVK